MAEDIFISPSNQGEYTDKLWPEQFVLEWLKGFGLPQCNQLGMVSHGSRAHPPAPCQGDGLEMGSGEGRAGLGMAESSMDIGQFNAPGNTELSILSIFVLCFLMHRVGCDCLFSEMIFFFNRGSYIPLMQCRVCERKLYI